MNPLQGSQIDWSVFKKDKYYIHVYQTKIERSWKDLRTVHSKSIARYLSQNWPSQYSPRLVDIKLIEAKANTTGANRHQSSATSYRPRSRISDPRNRINQQDTSEASTLRTRRSANTSNSNSQRRKRYLWTVEPQQRVTEEISQSELSESKWKQSWRRDRVEKKRGTEVRNLSLPL